MNNRQMRYKMKDRLIFVKKYTNSAVIDTSGTDVTKHFYPNISDSDKDTFGPFNSLSVHNYSSVAVEIRFESNDTTRVEIIPSGAIFEIEPRHKFYFLQPIITNSDDSYQVPIGAIIVILRKEGVYGFTPNFEER